MPVLFIITGPNGAGKSTVGHTYLPEKIRISYTPFDGDKLALLKRKELLPVIKSVKEAKKAANEWVYDEFLRQSKAALQKKDHFVYEGHFRDKATLSTPRKFKRNGYTIHLVFMGLSEPGQSELRVLERAKQGGHYVPMYEIEANFYGNLQMLNNNFRLFDELIIIDSSSSIKNKVLLHLRRTEVLFYTHESALPAWFIRFLPKLLKIIRKESRK